MILAGGQSRRMGQDKARLVVGGVPLIDRVASVLSTLGTVTVVGGTPDIVDVISANAVHRPDDYPGEGPLGGILSALSASEHEWTLVAACDLATLSVGTIEHLVSHGQQTNADVAVPLVGGVRQWHLGLWHQRCWDSLKVSFDSGERSIRAATSELRQTVLVTSDLSSYIDLDTAEDLRAFDEGAKRNRR